MHIAVVCLMATLVVKADHCSGGGECPSDVNPHNVASLLKTKPQLGAVNDCGEDSHCSSGSEYPSNNKPQFVVSLLQTKLQMNVLKGDGEESSSEALHGEKSSGKKEPRQLDMLVMENASAMLSEFEGMISAGESPAFDVISRIKGFVENDLMPGLATLRNLSTQDTNEFLDTIQSCNDASKKKEGEIEGNIQVSVNMSRFSHAACRDSEKILYTHNWTSDDSYCVKLGKFLHEAAELTLHIPADERTRDASVEYVERASDTNLCGRSEVRGLADSCAAKEDELTSKSDDCDVKQEKFEVDFCTWKTQLESNCEVLDTCHADAVSVYDNHVAKTKTLVEKWDAETATLKKILCYCNAWLSATDAGDNRSQHNATQFEACRDQTHTPVPVNYGTRPEKAVCSLTSVDNYPGTPGFTTQEYSNFLEFIQKVVACPQASTDAPTTAAPMQAHSFALGTEGSDDCPTGHETISADSECQSAAHALGLVWNSYTTGSWTNNRPYGCSLHVPTQIVHNNPYSGGVTSENDRRICVAAPTDPL